MTRELLQYAMVIMVLLATIVMAFINNETAIIFNLVTLCFGYYFGSQNNNPPPAAAAA